MQTSINFFKLFFFPGSVLLLLRRLPLHVPARVHADLHQRSEPRAAGHRRAAVQVRPAQVPLHICVGGAGGSFRQQPAGLHEPAALC